MSVNPAPPAQTRAIIVGIERYANLGDDFDVPGAISGALSFARWLVTDRHVPAEGIELWLLPRDDAANVQAVAAAAGLGLARTQRFTWESFRVAMSRPTGALVGGRFLIVYYCGHGTEARAQGLQHLVLPEASEQQVICFTPDNWRTHFRSSGWEAYAHQLWIIDACRSTWGEGLRIQPVGWLPGATQDVPQCTLLACGGGQSAWIDAQRGPHFTHALLARLQSAPRDEWPRFDDELRATAVQLRDQPDASYPTMAVGQDWYGLPMSGPGLAGPRLYDVLSGIEWSLPQFRAHLARTQATHHVPSMPDGLLAALEKLHGLPLLDDVPPELDFAERVARASGSAALRQWIDDHATAHQLAHLDHRLKQDARRARLLLWYRNDGTTPCIEAELDIIDQGNGVMPWPRQAAKAVTGHDVDAVLGAWLQAVFDHMRFMALDLVIEIFLPRSMLPTTTFDMAVVPLADNDHSRLGHDHPALLRCTDRFKGSNRFTLWSTRAPKILARNLISADPLRWAVAADNADRLNRIFAVDGAAAPIWLGFDPSTCGGNKLLDMALAMGLPAVIWLRAPASIETLQRLQTELRQLLRVSLDELPRQLAHWRVQQDDEASQTVAFMLDDPERKPKMFASWSQPLGPSK